MHPGGLENPPPVDEPANFRTKQEWCPADHQANRLSLVAGAKLSSGTPVAQPKSWMYFRIAGRFRMNR